MIEKTIIEAHETGSVARRPTTGVAVTTILLIRHAAHAHLGRVLSGRIDAIPLSSEGRAQARRLARRLEGTKIDLLQCSPVQRARETAEAIAASRSNLTVEIEDALDEIDFGDWAGLAFADLDQDPRWRKWNAARATSAAPNGESMAEAQRRTWRHVERAARDNPGRKIAMVTHCDIIRAVVSQVQGRSLDEIHGFEIAPASVSVLTAWPGGAELLVVNGCCDD